MGQDPNQPPDSGRTTPDLGSISDTGQFWTFQDEAGAMPEGFGPDFEFPSLPYEATTDELPAAEAEVSVNPGDGDASGQTVENQQGDDVVREEGEKQETAATSTEPMVKRNKRPRRRKEKVPAPQAPGPPPGGPQRVAVVAQGAQRLLDLINSISREHRHTIFDLFCAPTPKGDVDFGAAFLEKVMPRLEAANRNARQIVAATADRLRQDEELISLVENPPLPQIFNRRRQTRAAFWPLSVSAGQFDLVIPQRIRNGTDTIVIGYTCLMNGAPCDAMVSVDGAGIMPLFFGEYRPIYVLAGPGPLRPRLRIMVRPMMNISWFVVNYVVKKPMGLLISEALSLPPGCDDDPVLARTGACRGCSFEVAKVLEKLIRLGSAKCPRCGKPVMIRDLVRIPPKASEKARTLDESPEMKQARLLLSDQLSTLLRPKQGQPIADAILNWTGNPFERASFESDDIEDMMKDT